MRTRFELEYPLKCSVKVLFPRLSTPEGLAEWFADEVTAEGDDYTFFWNKSVSSAKLTLLKENKLVRFNWIEPGTEDEDNYFEFRITSVELSDDVALIISDLSEEEEREDAVNLWDSEVQRLKTALGL